MKKLLIVPLLCLFLASCPSVLENEAGANPDDYDIHIYSAQDLMNFRDDVNIGRNGARTSKILLMNDITLPKTNWIPIGDLRTDEAFFRGIFDGNGHTIFGLYFLDGEDEDSSNIGLFGRIKKGGSIDTEIKNLTIENAYINAHDRIGALASNVEYDVKITNTNVVFSYIIGNTQVGGFFGSCDGIVDSCFNYSYVEGFLHVGGIAGEMGNYSDTDKWRSRISNTVNAGIVQSNSNKEYDHTPFGTGGIIGYSRYSTIIEHCKNTGEVTSVGGNVGGITGHSLSDQIINCTNEGYVYGSDSQIGGISGYFAQEDNGDVLKIASCINEGTVVGDNINIGGIAGTSWADSLIEDSYNVGVVRSTGYNPPTTSEPGVVGGLVGFNRGRVQGSYNRGKVEALGGSEGDIRSKNIAGLTGYNTGTIIASYNLGAVYTPVKVLQAGALVGDNDGRLIGNYNIGILNDGESKAIIGLNNGNVTHTYFTDSSSEESGALASVGAINSKINAMNAAIAEYDSGSVAYRFRQGNRSPILYKAE